MEFCDWLLSHSILFSILIHIVGCISILFFFMAKYYSIVWIYQIVLIHSSVDEHLDFPISVLLWLILWTFIYKFLHGHMFSIILRLYLEVKLLGHMVVLRLIFEKLPNCLKWQHHFTCPPAMHEGSGFSVSLPTLLNICLTIEFCWVWNGISL